MNAPHIPICWEVTYCRKNGEWVSRTFDTESAARFFASGLATITSSVYGVKGETIEVREIVEVIL